MNRSASISLLAFAAVLLSACAAPSPSDIAERTTPDEAKEQVFRYYADVRAAVGDDEWTEMSSWGPCQVDGHPDEVQWTFSAQRFASLTLTPKSYGEQIAAAWADGGLEPSAGVDPSSDGVGYLVSDPPSLSGIHPDGAFTQISIDPRSALFRAKSVCVFGRIDDLGPPQS